MATKALTTEQAQEAIDVLAACNNVQTDAAAVLKMHPATFRNRMFAAQRMGLTPRRSAETDDALHYDASIPVKASDDDETDAALRAIRSRLSQNDRPVVADEATEEHVQSRRLAPTQTMGDSHLGVRHIVLPDMQIKEGVPMEHLEHIGNYLVEKQPDLILNIGDMADMPSLSIYDKGKLQFENRRYVDDIRAVRRGMEMLMKPIDDYNRTAKVPYKPRKVMCLGNHEYRIIRTVQNSPEFEGKFLMTDLGYEEAGWEVIPFLVPIEIDGVEYCHYFTSGVMGRPVSSAAALLRARQKSATMGHVQSTDIAMHQKTQQTGMFCGTCYLHDEDYLGPQGNVTRRQIVVKNEVRGGVYDPMLVSLAYLKKRYS